MANSVKTFIELAVAIIKGDDAEAKAIKIQQRAKRNLEAQLAGYNLSKNTAEDDLEMAKENYDNALVNNGELITDNDAYLDNLVAAHDKVETAQSALDVINDNINMFNTALARISTK